MRVACFTDLRFTANAWPTGVSKHLVNMICGLATQPDVKLTMIATCDQLAEHRIPRGNHLSGLPVIGLPGTNNTMEGLWQLFHYPHVDRWIDGADWVYCPKNDLVPVKHARWAATIHAIYECDSNLQRFNSTVSGRVAAARWGSVYRYMARHATVILTVSEFLKSQIVSLFNASSDKVVVIGNGVEDVYFEAARLAKGYAVKRMERPYILSVGGLNYLDGADYLLPVAKVFENLVPEMRFLIAGNQHEKRYLEQAKGIRNIELLGYVPSQDLAGLMRDAELFLFLSRYETFGIAVAEAMAAGAPVIASNNTAIPEIVGGGGIIVDPAEVSIISDIVLDLHRSPARREELRQRGIKRAAQYTWKSCVDRLYKTLLTY
jgi:glycosyltransferase involved in cell wall biosynthesis